MCTPQIWLIWGAAVGSEVVPLHRVVQKVLRSTTTTARLDQRGGLLFRMTSYVLLPQLQELLGEFSVALPQLFGFLLHGRDPLFDRQKPGAGGVAVVVGRCPPGMG